MQTVHVADPPARSVVMFSPLPPTPNGIADYTFEILQLLTQSVTCTVVVDDGVSRPLAPAGASVITLADYERQETNFADVLHIYQIGNNRDHVYMLRVMARHPGLVVLHDPSLHHLLDCATIACGDLHGYADALEAEYGANGRLLGDQFRRFRLREQRMFYDLPVIDGLVGPARGVIVHSRYAAVKALARAPDVDVTIVPHQYSPPRSPITPRSETRRSLGISPNEVLFVSLGFATRAKRIEDTLRALASVRHKLPPFRYVIAGELLPEELDVMSLVSSLKLDKHVLCLGYVADTDFFSLIEASDVVVNLRHPIGGETSGSMIRCLGGGACVVVVDRGPFAEIPDGCVCKISWGSGFEVRLATALLTLANDPQLRRGIAGNARDYIRRCNSLAMTVNGYLAAIEKAACRPSAPWRSTVERESLTPHELTRLRQAMSPDEINGTLPLWFRSGMVLTCEKPVRCTAWASPSTGALLASLGLTAQIRPLKDLVSGQLDDKETWHALDFVLIAGTVEEFGDNPQWLIRINRCLAFGGMLVLNIKSTAAGAQHPLEQMEAGTRLLQDYAFRVDQVTAVALPLMEQIPSGSGAMEASDERCWRAVKVSEFVTANRHQGSLTRPFLAVTPCPP